MSTAISPQEQARELAGRVFDAQRQRESDAVGAYRTLVCSIADGRGGELTQTRAASVLEGAGKSSADLEKDVATLLERREARKVLDEAAAGATRRAELSQQLVDLQDAHRKLLESEYEKFRTACTPLEHELRSIDNVTRRAADAQARLTGELAPPELAAQIAEKRAQLQSAERQGFSAGSTLAHQQAQVKYGQANTELQALLKQCLVVE